MSIGAVFIEDTTETAKTPVTMTAT